MSVPTKCEVCRKEERKPGPSWESFIVPTRQCAGCGGHHPVCASCAFNLSILDLTPPHHMPFALSACPDAAQVAREMMGNE